MLRQTGLSYTSMNLMTVHSITFIKAHWGNVMWFYAVLIKNNVDSYMDPSMQYFIQNQVQLHHNFDCDQDVTDRWPPL